MVNLFVALLSTRPTNITNSPLLMTSESRKLLKTCFTGHLSNSFRSGSNQQQIPSKDVPKIPVSGVIPKSDCLTETDQCSRERAQSVKSSSSSLLWSRDDQTVCITRNPQMARRCDSYSLLPYFEGRLQLNPEDVMLAFEYIKYIPVLLSCIDFINPL